MSKHVTFPPGGGGLVNQGKLNCLDSVV